MTTALPSPEPAAGPWTVIELAAAADLLQVGRRPTGRPRIVAIDGRGAGGKSTLAASLHGAVASSAVVHTDDIAWHETFFGWGSALREQVLQPVRGGLAVDHRPPAWITRDRPGSILVAAGLDLVIVEGVGAAQRAVADLVDAVVWVQSDFAEAERRGISRDIAEGVNGDPAQTVAFWHEWMAAELTFLADERPWERADLIVCGTPIVPHRSDQLVVAPGPLVGP